MKLESNRLIYEKVTQNLAKELENVLCDAEVYQYVDNGVAPTPKELLESFKQREQGPPTDRQSEIWIDYIIRIKTSQTAIGRVEATVVEHRAEVAYFIGTDFQRQGYGSEALEWLEGFAIANHNVTEFWATVTPGNERSKQFLLTNGYRLHTSDERPKLLSYDEGNLIFSKKPSSD